MKRSLTYATFALAVSILAQTAFAGPRTKRKRWMPPTQVVDIEVSSVRPLTPVPGINGSGTPAMVQVSGWVDLGQQRSNQRPANLLVSVGDFSTRLHPGKPTWSLLIAVDEPILPRVRLFQYGYNITTEVSSVYTLPTSWTYDSVESSPATSATSATSITSWSY